jgi:hypothetical protein
MATIETSRAPLGCRPVKRVARATVFLLLLASACTGTEQPPNEGPATGPSRPVELSCRFDHARPRRGEVPMAVDALGANDVWVVGARYVGGTAVPFASNWDGKRWDSAPVEVIADANAGFHDVALADREDAWAVGWLRAEAPMVQRWDGAAWTSVTIPATGTVTELFGVTAPSRDSMWAAGRVRDGRRDRPLVLRWDGTALEEQDVPSPAAPNATLRGIDAAGDGGAWAVGWTVAPGGRHRTLAMRFRAGVWRSVRTPNPGPGDHVLSGISVLGPDDAWAVGWAIPQPDHERALLLRWDGRRWATVPPPRIPGRAQLIDVAADGPDDVWAVGRATDREEVFRSLVLHWDGTTWARIRPQRVRAGDNSLAAVALAQGSPWTVGTAVDQGGIYRSVILSGC